MADFNPFQAGAKRVGKATNQSSGFDPFAAGAKRVGQAELRSRDVTIGDRIFDAASAVGLPASRMRSDISGLGAFGSGALQGASLNTADEAEAALKTGFGLTGDFGEEVESIRARNEFTRKTNPRAFTAGELTGILGTGAAAASKGLLASSRLAPGASLPTRAAAAGLDAGGFGFVGGLGAGEGIEDKFQRAGVGLAIGVPTGAAIPLAGAGFRAASGAAKNKFGNALNTVFRPERAAQRQVGGAFAIDGPPVIDDAAAALNNQQVLNVDRGGETTRALARSVANQNPEARGALDRIANDRFATQGNRAASLIDRVMGGAVDDVSYREALKAEARRANRNAYKIAYRQGEEVILTPEMERLMSSPVVKRAMKQVATGSGQNRAVADGFGSFNPGVNVTDDGRIVFTKTKAGGNTAFPDLQFWDYVKRELDDSAQKAFTSGATSEGTAISQITNVLRNELDAIIPAYRQARQGAAAFFGAEDALEAGRKFVTMPAGNVRKEIAAIRKMNRAEKQAFQTGFAAELKAKIGGVQDRTNVIKTIFGSESARSKIRLALGRENFKEFKAFVEIENASDMLRGALGNSTTARQLTELGIGAGLGSGAEFQQTGGFTGIGAMTGAGIAAALRAGGVKANQNTMKKVADILLSEDPAKISAGAKLIAKSAEMRFTLDKIQNYIQTRLIAPATAITAQ